MKIKIIMYLQTDVIFGNGISIPGGEDLSVQKDDFGFPYYKGGTFKGIFREELERHLEWMNKTQDEINSIVERMLGESGDDNISDTDKMIFEDFRLSEYVTNAILEQVGENPGKILNCLTHMRTFNSIDDNGTTKKGSLRYYRCVNKGLCFYSNIECNDKYKELITDVIQSIKWIGTMRNRGFGKVTLSVE